MRFSLAAVLFCGLAVAVVQADNWPNWRGPHANGVASGTNYPLVWNNKDGVLWKASLPGKGASTPIVWGDKIFLTCGVEGQNTLLCLDRAGKMQWKATVGQERAGKHKKGTGSNPSAVTDGQLVYAYFKSGDLAALDFDGKIVWQQNLQQLYGADTLWWDLGTSPVLTKQDVVVAVMQSGPSYLVAFDKASGQLHWKQDRNLDAPSEAAQSYSTPLVLDDAGREILVVLGADHVTGHDAATGSELWRVGGLNPTGDQYFRSICSPVAADGIVVAPYARGASVTAIRLGGSGDVTKTHVLWTKQKIGADVPTPAIKDGKVYLLTDKGVLNCLDLQTGETIWSGQFDKNRNAYTASPILADGRIYLTREDGTTYITALNEFRLLSTNHLEGEFIVATPVFTDGRILFRTAENLYCIGK